MTTIPELEEEFSDKLSKWGASYCLFKNRQTSRGIDMGEHITICYPPKIRLTKEDVKEMAALVEEYYYPIARTENRAKVVINGKHKEITFEFRL